LDVKNIVIYALIVLLASSLQSQLSFNTTPQQLTVQAISPTFITLAEIPNCDREKEFPQTNSLPYWRYAAQIQYSCDVYEKDNVSWTMLIFYELWKETFGDTNNTVKEALEQLQITWGQQFRIVNNVYSIDGTFHEAARVSGLVEDDYKIWVLAENNISDTSFIHELVHIALMHSCGSADPDHEGESFPCWTLQHSMFIDEVNTELMDRYSL
jgi:hypothetical protein